ncbi:MAG TPA: membrane protein insertase YidC [Ktedonobacterales bacterium]|nr:membrane protein insertase YidC [Ktedonobacterales bacterium]
MESLFSGIGDMFGVLFAPIHTVFQYVFFLPVFNILMLIYQGVHSFGLSIILLTLLIRGSLYPLTRKQLASSRKMQELAPKLKQLQAQYRGDTQGMVAAQQALYKEHGVSMYGGCLPLLIQMPFLYALYYSFEQVLMTKGDVLKATNELIYPFLPHLTAAPETTFLGFSLIAPSFFLALLAGVLTFLQMRMALPIQPVGASAPKDATSQATRSMQYIMPFFTFFIGTRFPAGLALYWAVSTGFSAVQQYFISGWGSLWVGVPGMERFVPKPPEAPVATSPATGARRGAAAPTAPQPLAPKGGFFSSLRESIRQIQEQASAQGAADRAAAEARRADSRRVVEGAPGAEEPEARGESEAQTERARQQKNVGGGRDRRSRGVKSGVTLVRPPSNSSLGAGDATPETRIAEENSGSQPSPDELPEKRIAREAALTSSSTNGARTSGGAGSTRSGAKGGSGKSSGQNGHGGARGAQQSGPRNRSRGSR